MFICNRAIVEKQDKKVNPNEIIPKTDEGKKP
jgi:hypothetical protein